MIQHAEPRSPERFDLRQAKRELDRCFARRDLRAAHLDARYLLSRLAATDAALHEIFTKCLLAPGFLESKRINPVVALPIFETAAYTLVANVWIPRPDGRTDLSHQSIHHHGNLLLTSVSAFGPGYESVIYGKMNGSSFPGMEQVFQHERGNLEFVDVRTPHIVFYPARLSVTYALWSREQSSFGRSVTRSAPLRALKPSLKWLSRRLGLKNLLSSNPETNLDFYVEGGKILPVGNRVMYEPGSNQNFIEAIRFIAAEIGYKDERGLARILAKARPERPPVNEFEAHHLHLPKVNLLRSEVMKCR